MATQLVSGIAGAHTHTGVTPRGTLAYEAPWGDDPFAGGRSVSSQAVEW